MQLPNATPDQIAALSNELSEMATLLMNVQPTPELAIVRTKIREAKLWCDAYFESVQMVQAQLSQPYQGIQTPMMPSPVQPQPRQTYQMQPQQPAPPTYQQQPQQPQPMVPTRDINAPHPAVTTPIKSNEPIPTRADGQAKTPQVIDGRNSAQPRRHQDPAGTLPAEYGRDDPQYEEVMEPDPLMI